MGRQAMVHVPSKDPHSMALSGGRIPVRRPARTGLLRSADIGGWAVALLIGSCVGVAAGAPGLQPAGPLIRISDAIGSPVGSGADAREPSVAYNARDGEFLAVWRADTRVDNQAEVFGQLLDRAGNRIGGEILIAMMEGGDDATDPDTVYNADRNEYVVVWSHLTTTDVNDVFGQRLTAGGELAGERIQISDLALGTSATSPAIAYNSSADHEYLVVWNSDEGALSGEGSTQIWGQRLDDTGGVLGGDFQVSNLGAGSSVAIPDVTYNSVSNQYMVVWNGDLTIPVDTNKETYGQLLNANGSESTPEFQITNATPSDNHALSPHVAHNSTDNEYLVVYSLANEDEIFGQRLDSLGGEIGEPDFQISDKAAVLSPGFTRPNLVHNPVDNVYVVAWRETTGVIDVFGQVVAGDGSLVGSQAMISDVQADTGETNRDVGDTPRLAHV